MKDGGNFLHDDFFNLTDISDIPEEIKMDMKKKLRPLRNPLIEDILFLLEVKTELSVNELLVGLYRLRKERVPRKKLTILLNTMRNRKMLIGSTYTSFQKLEADSEEVK